MPDAKSSTVVVQRGVYTVARKTVDTEGNTIRETPPQWREDSLGKALGFHWPNFAAIFEKMRESEVDFCQFCGEDLQKCMLCPFNSYNN